MGVSPLGWKILSAQNEADGTNIRHNSLIHKYWEGILKNEWTEYVYATDQGYRDCSNSIICSKTFVFKITKG